MYDVTKTPEFKLGFEAGKTQTLDNIKQIMVDLQNGTNHKIFDAELYTFREVLKVMLDDAYQQGLHDGSW